MSIPTLRHSPSMESNLASAEIPTTRRSLYEAKDDFISRVAPIGMAAIYFGSFTLAPQDAALSRQALFKLSFLHRHFLHPVGLRVQVTRQTATLSGEISSAIFATMGEILALQIEGIEKVKNETEVIGAEGALNKSAELQIIQLLFATDQTLHSCVRVMQGGATIELAGQVSSDAQKNWAEQLARGAGADVVSRVQVLASAIPHEGTAADVDDESLQALVLMRLRLSRETEHLPVRVKAHRGVIHLHGKVRTEALRQRVENITRSTLGARELRSSMTITA